MADEPTSTPAMENVPFDVGEPKPIYVARPRGSFWARLRLIDHLLKQRQSLFEDILHERDLSGYVVDMVIVSFLLTAAYGAVVGAGLMSGRMMLTNAVKMPWILLCTLALCVPTLYIFSAYLGSPLRFLQTLAITTTSIAVIAIVFLAFAPITWFFMFTANHVPFGVFVNLCVFSIAGLFGVSYMFSAVRYVYARRPDASKFLNLVRTWLVLYGVVGAQMAYMLAPYFHESTQFFNKRGGNVFVDIVQHLGRLFGG